MVTVQAELCLKGCGETEQHTCDPLEYLLEFFFHVCGSGHVSVDCHVSSWQAKRYPVESTSP